MSTLTDERLGKIITALLLADFDGIPSERLPEALEDLKVELEGLGICTPEEAEAVTKKVLALRFADQYPPKVLAGIQEKRVREIEHTFPH